MNQKHYPVEDILIGNSALIAGIALILMAILAPIANFAIIERFVVPDDAAKTVSNIVASKGLFRMGICFLLIVAVLDIIVAWALYVFLKPINRSLALLTAWFRVAYAIMLGVSLVYLVHSIQLVSGCDFLTAFESSQLHALVMLSLNNFKLGWEMALIVFGFHLLMLGYLFIKAGYMRRILGWLIILAALGYLIDGFGKLLLTDYNIIISMYTFIGEVILIFWLLIVGRKIKKPIQTKEKE